MHPDERRVIYETGDKDGPDETVDKYMNLGDTHSHEVNVDLEPIKLMFWPEMAVAKKPVAAG